MEILRLYIYVILVTVIIYYAEAKTFSINEALAAESQKKPALETRQPKVFGNRRYNSKKRIVSTLKSKVHELGKQEHIYAGTQRISPLQYRKTFQINSPLRPKKLKRLSSFRNRRKNQSVKREISGNEKLKQKYIPLLKNLGLLFDNLLSSDTGESVEVKTKKYKRNRYYSYSEEGSGEECPCKPSNKTPKSRKKEKANSIPETFATEISSTTETTTTTADYPAIADISTVRPNKIISVLFPRNTFGSRGDDNGFSEGSSTSHNRDTERNISWSDGDSEYNTGREDDSYTESHEEISNSASRDDASSDRSTGRILGVRNDTRISEVGTTEDETTVEEDQSAEDSVGEDQFEIRRNKTKGAQPISEPIRRLRGFLPKYKVSDIPESVQSEEIREESNDDVPLDKPGNKRVFIRSSTSTAENKKARAGNETVRAKLKPKLNKPVLMIFDGYSVTRDKNGENKLTEKSISIHS